MKKAKIYNGMKSTQYLMFATLKDFDLKDRKVLLRVDINLPIEPETMDILDDTRIMRILAFFRHCKASTMPVPSFSPTRAGREKKTSRHWRNMLKR